MSKSLYDNLRFVYETEDTIMAGSIVSIPEVEGPGGILPLEPLGDTPRGGGGSNPKTVPKDPTNTTGKDQDKTLLSGSSLVSACWVLNEYPGLHPWKEDGVSHLYTGETNFISNEPFYGFRVKSGFGWSGQGANPDLYQGFMIELFTQEGGTGCRTYSFENPHCRYPGRGFPLDAKECTGEDIGGDPGGPQGHATVESMWDRFKACMRGYYPQCGDEPVE